MGYDDSLSELEARREKIKKMGSPKRLAERKAAGILNARERVDAFVDPGSFTEVGLHAHASNPQHRDKSPADGVITGFGDVDGRPVAIVAHDFTTLGASTATVYSRKTHYVQRVAREKGIPFVLFGEAGGARLPDALDAGGFGAMALGGKGSLGRDRTSPWATAILGQAFGGPTWDAVRSDYVVMRRGAAMGVSSRQVTAVAVSEGDSEEEYCGWRMHTRETGMADLAVESDLEALASLRSFLSYVPSHNLELPPSAPVPSGSDEGAKELLEIVPDNRRKTYDMHRVIEAIFDRDSFFPLKGRHARVVITGLARLGGEVVGVVASNPRVKGGAMDGEACDKATSFVVFCDSFNIPLIMLADTPGFLVGLEGERRKLAGKVTNFLDALATTTVPLLTLVLRKAYGLSYLNFGGGLADALGVWSIGEASLMAPEVAVNVIHGVRADNPDFPARLAEMQQDTSAYALASTFAAHEVLDPRESRSFLVRMLDVHRRRMRDGIGEHLLRNWPTTV
jgi:acetyl-CoA carboxylase carboxyltransferase component